MDWKVGDKVYVRNAAGSGDKLRPAFRGPYDISTVHTNGNVTVCQPNGVQERLNVRRLKPSLS